MRHPRAALLALAVLFGGAAGDYGPDPADGTTRFVGTGAFGDYLQGRFAAQHADLQVAADKLEAALTLDPGLAELTNQAFIASVMAARPDAVRIAMSLPDNPIARLVLSDHEAKAGNWRAAAGGFDTLPGGSSLVEALRPLLVAWAQLGGGQPDAAISILRTAMEAGRNRPVLTLHLALADDLAGRRDDAARLYAAARVEYGGLNLRLAQVLASWQARSGDADGAAVLVSDLAAGDGELALARGNLIQQAVTPAVRNASDGLAEVYLAMAATLHQQNANDLAQLLLRLSLDMRPDFAPALMLLSDIQDIGKLPQAALDTLAATSPSDALTPVIMLRRANLLDELDRTDEAAAVLETLAADHPDRAEPLAQLGDILRRRSRFPEAVAAFDRAVARVGTPTRANWPLFYERGIALERAGQWPRAEADFLFALELSPDQPGVLNYLGYAWADQGRNLDRARGMVERAVEQRPEEGSYVDSLGWIMLLQGDKDGAMQQLERAVTLMPGDATVNGHFGDALEAVGRKREAAFQWRSALILQPEPAEAARIEAKLAALPPGEDAGPAPSVP
ncbi:MAG TPA: tetratricopeptide repeat protein [Acetobacteraceae bacterium]